VAGVDRPDGATSINDRAQSVRFRSSGLDLLGDRWQARVDQECHGTVLLLHGGGQRRHSWQMTGQRLTRHGWNAIAMDARGHGDSDWSPSGDYSSDALVGDLVTIIAGIGEPVVLVGASMGGMTALLGEGERGGLARGLVLVDIVPRIEPDGVRRIHDFMTASPKDSVRSKKPLMPSLPTAGIDDGHDRSRESARTCAGARTDDGGGIGIPPCSARETNRAGTSTTNGPYRRQVASRYPRCWFGAPDLTS